MPDCSQPIARLARRRRPIARIERLRPVYVRPVAIVPEVTLRGTLCLTGKQLNGTADGPRASCPGGRRGRLCPSRSGDAEDGVRRGVDRAAGPNGGSGCGATDLSARVQAPWRSSGTGCICRVASARRHHGRAQHAAVETNRLAAPRRHPGRSGPRRVRDAVVRGATSSSGGSAPDAECGRASGVDRRYHGGWTTGRLASHAGVDETAMRKRLQRIRDKLRKEMEMSEQRGIRSDDIRPDLPAKVVELLARPRLTDLPENPVGRTLETIRSVFPNSSSNHCPSSSIWKRRGRRSAMMRSISIRSNCIASMTAASCATT